MDIELVQSLASVVRYIQDTSEIEAPPYFDDIPEAYRVPSIYFPVPITSCRKVTLSAYRSTIALNARFLYLKDWEAYQAAINVRDSILLSGLKIPMMQKDGTVQQGVYVNVHEPSIRKVDDGIVQMTCELDYYFEPNEQAEKVENVIINRIAKPSELYDAWVSATEDLRKEQEEQQLWLQKVLQNP